MGLAAKFVGLVDEVRVSIDALRDRNDGLRGKGTFDRAVRALRYLKTVGFEPRVLITVSAQTLPDLLYLLDFLYTEDVRRVTIRSVKAIGRGEEAQHGSVSTETIAKLLERFANAKQMDLPGSSSDWREETQSTCGVGRYVNIWPNGDVYPCHVLTGPQFHCGNVLTDDLYQMCAMDGVLGKWRQADFHKIAEQEPTLTPLTLKDTCLGSVYGPTADLPIWRTVLPSSISPAARALRVLE